MTSKNTKLGLFTLSLVALLTTVSAIPFAEAATLCSDTGVDGSSRCYAVSTYSPSSSPYEYQGFSSHQKFVNESPSNGFIQDSLWGIFSDGTVIEAGINDPQGTGAAKFVVAVDGAIKKTSSGSPSNNSQYWMDLLDTNEDGYWTLWAHNTSYTTNVGTSPTLYSVYVGSEAVYTNAPNFNTDHDDLDAHWNGSWVTPSSSNTWQGEIKSSGYYVDECGSSSEQYYHVNTGKGSAPNC